MKWVLRASQYGLALIGVLLLAYWGAASAASRLFQRRESLSFSGKLRTAQPAPPRQSPEGAVIARLEIPRLGLSTMVVEGDTERDLRRAAGHIPGTSQPGERGNAGIAGHRDTFFRPLNGIRVNDTIMVTTLRGSFTYRVTSLQVVRPNQTHVLSPTNTSSLTLVTCYPFYYVGPAPRRFIVRAEKVL